MESWLAGIDDLLFVREAERWLRNHAEGAEPSAKGHSVPNAPTGMSVDASGQVRLDEATTQNTGVTGSQS